MTKIILSLTLTDLVGIGTSVPSEFLDVRGTAKVVGLVTASDVFVSGVSNHY